MPFYIVSGLAFGKNPNPLENFTVNIHLLPFFCIAGYLLDGTAKTQ